MSNVFSVALAMFLAFGQGSSTNFSGKWALPQAGRNGARAVSVLTINQAGERVTGTLSTGRSDAGTGATVGAEIFGAKVDGDTLTFYVWRGNDRPVKQFYKGLKRADEIDFTVTGGQAFPNAPSGPAPAQITAKRTAD